MIDRVIALYFSPTRTTQKIVTAIGKEISQNLNIAYSEIDITTPKERKNELIFSNKDLVIFGAPVYIGRMPNLIVPYFKTIRASEALGVPVAVYGNRAYDDGLIELRDIMESIGFRLVAAGAFVAEHTFSYILGGNRPDYEDIIAAKEFGKQIAGEIGSSPEKCYGTINVPGTPYPYSGFYKATDGEKRSIDIRKVVPKTDKSKCTLCGKCAEICSMGAIDPQDYTNIIGKCIKCGACLKRCPQGAKYFDDPQYLSHLKLLEDKFSSIRCTPETFFPTR